MLASAIAIRDTAVGHASDNQTRLLETLVRLLELPAPNLRIALAWAADAVSAALKADKVDAFLHDPGRDSLVAVGTSNQPLSGLQKRLGLHVLPITNGGRSVEVFETGSTFATGRLDLDEKELRGIKEALGVRSQIGVPLAVGGVRRGVLMCASQQPDFFTAEDVRFAESVTRWVGVVAHRAELIGESGRRAEEQGRQAAAEELVTVLAHDLRNYLAPIDMRLKLLRRRAERERREPDIRDAELALRGLDRLGQMIADMLDLARIDRGLLPIEIEPVDLVPLIEDITAMIAGPDHKIEIHAAERPVVAADPDRVRQCLENLLANAVKHSPRGAPIALQVMREVRETGGFARVVISDEGPGIASDLLPRIFEPFVTGKSEVGGLGIGLYLARRIACLHGGELEVESSPGNGARFTLTLRCYPKQESTPEGVVTS